MNVEENGSGDRVVDLCAAIITAYVSNNAVPPNELPPMIGAVHSTLTQLMAPPAPEPPKPEPPIPIRRTVTPDHIISLEDGKPYKTLKRHLATEIFQADVAVEAVLHEMSLPLRRVLSLEVGDTIMFDAKPADLITLRCGDWAMTQGRIGRLEDSIAVQVTRPLRRARTTLAAFEASMQNRKDG